MSGTRLARALLVAGTKGHDSPTNHFLTGICEIAEFLPKRGFKTLLARVETNLTREAFVTALKTLAGAAVEGEIAIVMFGGHGDNGDIANREEGWLFRDEIFTDLNLATALQEFPAGVEKVVIADCCYAAGMFTPFSTLQTFVRERVRRMARAFEAAGASAAADFVIIASASKDEIVATSAQTNEFAESVRTETSKSNTYVELGEALRAASEHKSSHWSVDGRPEAALKARPLATS